MGRGVRFESGWGDEMEELVELGGIEMRREVGVKVANTAVGIPLGVGATNKVAVGVGESVGVGVGM